MPNKIDEKKGRIAQLEAEDLELQGKIAELRKTARDALVNGTPAAHTTEDALALNMRREAIADALEVLKGEVLELQDRERKKAQQAALDDALRHRHNATRFAVLFDTAMREAGDAFNYIADAMIREEAAMAAAGQPRTNSMRGRLNTRLIGTVRSTAPDLARALDLPGVNRHLEQTLETLMRKYFHLDAEEIAA